MYLGKLSKQDKFWNYPEKTCLDYHIMDIEDYQAKHLNFYEVISSQIFLILKASKATVHHKECYTLPGILEIWHNFFDISRIKSSNNLKTDDTTEILSNLTILLLKNCHSH